MTLRLCTNNAFEDCSNILVSDTSHSLTTDTDGIWSVASGPRHLCWTQSGTAGRILAYVNKSGNLAWDTFIMTRADRHSGHEFRLRSYATYSSSSTDHISSSNWAPTLVGARSQDFVTTAYSGSSLQALGIYLSDGTGGAYAKSVYPFYFCSSFSFPQTRDIAVTFQNLWLDGIVNRHLYRFEERVTLVVNKLTRANVQSLQALPKLLTEPCFLYDDSGYLLSDYLWHGLITRLNISQPQDDFHTVTLEFSRLRSYS